jgi:hypothetical protein
MHAWTVLLHLEFPFRNGSCHADSGHRVLLLGSVGFLFGLFKLCGSLSFAAFSCLGKLSEDCQGC